MGTTISRILFRGAWANRATKIVVLGLDAGGKTTALYKLKLGEITTQIPTIGMNIEQVKFGKKNQHQMLAWDVGGRGKIRPLWRHYFQNCDAIIFVVDSNDRERIGEAEDELHRNLHEDELAGIPVLVLANKQDLPHAMSAAEVTDKLGLQRIRDRQWFLQPTCATSGDGLYEGLDWLTRTIQTRVGSDLAAQEKRDESKSSWSPWNLLLGAPKQEEEKKIQIKSDSVSTIKNVEETQLLLSSKQNQHQLAPNA